MLGEGVEALDDDEHVVDADPEQQEGQHAVHRAEHQTQEGAVCVAGRGAIRCGKEYRVTHLLAKKVMLTPVATHTEVTLRWN